VPHRPPFDLGRRRSTQCLLALAAMPFASAAASAQSGYPDKSIRFIVPQPAGGTGDTVTRIISQRLAARLGKPIVIDNKAGAGGTLGATQAARSPADGYTIVMSSPGFATFESMFPKLSFNPAAELAPVGMMGSVPIALIVRADSPHKTLADFVAHAKAHAGQATYASAGNGALSHLMGAWFASEAGLNMVHVPYAGTAPALTALVGGQVDIYFDPMSSSELLKSGRVRALATTGERRTSMLPTVPTMIEQGYKISGSVWLGVMAPAGTPRPVIERLNRELNAVLQEPEVRNQLEARLVFPDPMGVEQFAGFFAKESQTWNKLVRDTGIKVE
jgi:tripartite-type tricarboxylate transporter receptor subunit TctC